MDLSKHKYKTAALISSVLELNDNTQSIRQKLIGDRFPLWKVLAFERAHKESGREGVRTACQASDNYNEFVRNHPEFSYDPSIELSEHKTYNSTEKISELFNDVMIVNQGRNPEVTKTGKSKGGGAKYIRGKLGADGFTLPEIDTLAEVYKRAGSKGIEHVCSASPKTVQRTEKTDLILEAAHI